jgi:hypothetical protein
VLKRKLAELQIEERSLLTQLCSHPRALQLEQMRLNQLFEEKLANQQDDIGGI